MRAIFRFYAELNDHLPAERKMQDIVQHFQGPASVKDRIESLGVPHTEVDLILVNGTSVDFCYLVQDEDRVSVYPMFESFDITPLSRLRPTPLREPRFVLDAHLGRLAVYLRMCGFDALPERLHGRGACRDRTNRAAHFTDAGPRLVEAKQRDSRILRAGDGAAGAVAGGASPVRSVRIYSAAAAMPAVFGSAGRGE